MKKCILPGLLILLLMSCKTTIAVEMKSPPELDYGEALNIELQSGEKDELHTYLKQELESLLVSDKRMNLLSEEASEYSSADLILNFNIQNILDNYEDRYIDLEDSEEEDNAYRVYLYNRNSTVYVHFDLVEAETGIIRNSFNAFDSAESEEEDFNDLLSFENLHYQAIDKILVQYRYYFISRKYTDYRVLRILEDKKDPRQDILDRLIRAKSYREAYELCLEIYREDSDPAARYNSILILEILGEKAQALEEMENFLAETGDKDAQRQVNRMRDQRNDQQLLSVE